MSLLLDTHVVLWWLTDDATLSDDIKDRLGQEPDVFVSTATVWEVAIKQAAGKIAEPAPGDVTVQAPRDRGRPRTSPRESGASCRSGPGAFV